MLGWPGQLKIGRRATGHWEQVRTGQSGRRIVDQAREIKAAAIVMPMSSGVGGWGRTLETMLRERPCRVVTESVTAPT